MRPESWRSGRPRAPRDARPVRSESETYRAIGMDIGTKDNLITTNKRLEQAMTRLASPTPSRTTTAITRTERRARRDEGSAVLLQRIVVHDRIQRARHRPDRDSATSGADALKWHRNCLRKSRCRWVVSAEF